LAAKLRCAATVACLTQTVAVTMVATAQSTTAAHLDRIASTADRATSHVAQHWRTMDTRTTPPSHRPHRQRFAWVAARRGAIFRSATCFCTLPPPTATNASAPRAYSVCGPTTRPRLRRRRVSTCCRSHRRHLVLLLSARCLTGATTCVPRVASATRSREPNALAVTPMWNTSVASRSARWSAATVCPCT